MTTTTATLDQDATGVESVTFAELAVDDVVLWDTDDRKGAAFRKVAAVEADHIGPNTEFEGVRCNRGIRVITVTFEDTRGTVTKRHDDRITRLTFA
jgi:hypothetical protein